MVCKPILGFSLSQAEQLVFNGFQGFSRDFKGFQGISTYFYVFNLADLKILLSIFSNLL